MEYPKELKSKVNNIFGPEDIAITLYSGLTTFVGANGSGKTQTLKALRNYLKGKVGRDKVRYFRRQHRHHRYIRFDNRKRNVTR